MSFRQKKILSLAGIVAVWLCALATLACVPPIVEAQPPAARQPSDLSNQLLDDAPTPQDPQSADNKKLQNAGPLAVIQDEMLKVQSRLQDRQIDQATTELQASIVKRLDDLMSQFQQQQSASTQSRPSASSAQSATGRPNETQSSSARKAEGTMLQSDPIGAAWGHLRDRLRQRIQSSMGEDYLPQYRRVISKYFERLADPELQP